MKTSTKYIIERLLDSTNARAKRDALTELVEVLAKGTDRFDVIGYSTYQIGPVVVQQSGDYLTAYMEHDMSFISQLRA